MPITMRPRVRNPPYGCAPLLLLAVAGCSVSSAALACATCGCALSADAATGYSSAAGWRLTFESDFINQDQLRGGSSPATPAQAVNSPSDVALGGGEVERQTINRYLTLGINYSPTSVWNFNLGVALDLAQPYDLRYPARALPEFRCRAG
ncbi:MAG: hypothetical protein WDM77_04815 [Steroidobacteraceae bacterium]